MTISRRLFSKLLGGLSLGPLQMGFKEKKALAQAPTEDPCKQNKVDILSSETAITIESEKILFWVNGLYYRDSVDLKRANIAFLLKYEQSQQRYIDKVVFANKEKETLAVRYFEAEDQIGKAYPPYIILNNVDLGASNQYYLVVQFQEEGTSKIYRKTWNRESLGRSKLDGTKLPATVRSTLSKDFNSFVTSPFYSSRVKKKDIAQHIVRAQVLELSSPSQFKIRVNFMHLDENQGHFMRYFIVTDPVGRILGIHKRNIYDTSRDHVIIGALTEKEADFWGLTSDNIGKIEDCPHIMVFVDDVAQAIGQAIIPLR